MSLQKIHCPICHGKGKIFDSTYGQIACLNCVGRGIVDLNFEQQKLIDKIVESQRLSLIEQERIEQERIKQEELRIQRIIENENIKRAEKESNFIPLFIFIFLIIAVVVISLIVFYWHEILNFLWEVIKGILIVYIIIVVFIAAISYNE